MPNRWCGNGVQAEDELLRGVRCELFQMKLMLVIFTIIFLSLSIMACSGSPDVQEGNGSSIAGNSSLSKVALEVPTIT